jgi:3-hydroxyacyl-CoA dehydrogenase / 3-hydroxy-2-methylbutyryl-CoA dehydrogenase
MDIKGKRAVVAGGASGLGRAVCVELSACGADVAVLDREIDQAQEVAREVGGVAVQVDVTSAESAERAITEVLGAFGGIDINVNTAGVPHAHKTVADGQAAPLDWFQTVIDVNLVGTFNILRLAVQAMLKSAPDAGGERGVIVNTSSGAAYEGQVGQAAYSASKAGVIGMAMPIARDLAGTGIRINTIAPGLFETPMLSGMPEKVRASLIEMTLEPRRLGAPAEFAALVRHIVENRYLNAECIRLDAATRLGAR